MTAEYERYHGIVLRELIVRAPVPLVLEACDEAGRVKSFCINGSIGLHIKHSSKRLPPWQFTFNHETVGHIDGLIDRYSSVWLVLVCGLDGVVALTKDEYRGLTAVQGYGARFIRVDRDRNTMYRIYGNTGKLQNAKARGVTPVVSDALRFPMDG